MMRHIATLASAGLLVGSLCAQPMLVSPLGQMTVGGPARSAGPSDPVKSGPALKGTSRPIGPIQLPSGSQEAIKKVRAFSRPQVKGHALIKAVKAVERRLDWNDKLEHAALSAVQTDKPILWIQALGTLTGYT